MLNIIIDNKIRINPNDLDKEVVEQLLQLFTFNNPIYNKAKAMKFYVEKSGRKYKGPSTRGKAKEIKGGKLFENELILPRGGIAVVLEYFNTIKQPYKIINKTRLLPPIDFQFQGTLWEAQIPAVQNMLSRKFSTICAPTGSGKTVMGIYTIAYRKQPTIIAVHTKELMEQWAGQIAGSKKYKALLDVEPHEIGYIGDNKKDFIGKKITIAMIQTLHGCAKEVAPHYGYFLMDELHHVPARTFRGSVEPFDCVFMGGLSATHKRGDGLQPMIYWFLGPLVHTVPLNKLVKEGKVLLVEPHIKQTSFWPPDDQYDRPKLITALIEDEKRNKQIVQDIIKEVQNTGGPCVVLTERKIHCETLANLINEKKVTAAVIHSDIQNRKEVLVDLYEDKIKVIVATGTILGEGFDENRLSALFLATPISFSERLVQYLGRVGRAAEGKTGAKVYDYHDINCDIIMKSAMARMKVYRKLAKQAKEPIKKIK